MGIFSWVIIGLIVGVLAKLIMPGIVARSLIVALLLGITGAFVGGFLGTRSGFVPVLGFNMSSILLSIGGAIVLLILFRIMKT